MAQRYDSRILTCVAAADRPLRHSEIAARVAPGDNRAWSAIGTSLTRLYRAGQLTREKIDGRYWHYLIGGGGPVMIRFLNAAGLPVAIYAVELDGTTYTPAEIAAAAAVSARLHTLYEDVARWRESGDARDLRYVIDTMDELEAMQSGALQLARLKAAPAEAHDDAD